MPEKKQIALKDANLFMLVFEDGSVRVFLDETKRDDFLKSWEEGQEIERAQ